MRDEFDADDDEDGEDTPLEQWGRNGVFEKAKMAVRPAAICFLVLGFMGIFYGIYQFIAYAKFDQQWDLQLQMQQSNAGVPGPQQQRMADMMDSMKGPMKAFMLFSGVSCTVVALLMMLTGVLLLKLRGRTMVYVGAIVSLLPVTYCCMGGLPLGIWTLVILSRRDVKAGFRIAEDKRLRVPDESAPAEPLEFREDETKYAISLARQRTPLPGLFLIIFGILSIIVGSSSLALALSQPDLSYELVKKFATVQVTQQRRDAMLKQIDARKDDYRLDQPMVIASLVLGLMSACVMLYGGMQMRRLRNYKWCVAGAICAIASLHGCSIFALPFGLWALIALSNVYVRHAFNCLPREEQREDCMPRTATCPHCGIEMDVPPDLHGGEIECPACAKPFTPPEEEPEEVAPPPRHLRSRRRDEEDDFEDFDRPSPERRREIAQSRIRGPAIAMMIVAALQLIGSGISMAVMGAAAFVNAFNNPVWVVIVVFGVVEFTRTCLTLFGSWQLLNVRSWGWGLVAAILLIIPSCCHFHPCSFWLWFLNLGFGVWALVIINDSDVRWLIRQKQREEREMERDAL